MTPPRTLRALLSCSLAATAGAAVQDDGPGPPPPPAVERRATLQDVQLEVLRRSDAVIGVAGDELVLQGDLYALIRWHPDLTQYRDAVLAGAASEDRALHEALKLQCRSLIRVQAGRALGFDPERVEEVTDRFFEEQVERLGGPRAFHAEMSRGFGTAEAFRAQVRDKILGDAWEDSVAGRAAGATGRAAVDRYISPGQLREFYLECLRSQNPEERALVGMEPERVQLQYIVIDAAQEDAEVLARTIRGQVEQGADFAVLIENHGVRVPGVEDGMLRPTTLDTLRVIGRQNHGDAQLYDFARQAPVGALLGPLETAGQGGARGWSVYRLVERLPAQGARPFLDRATQKRLRAYLQERLDEVRVRAAFAEELADAFVRPGDLKEFLLQQGVQ